MTIEVSADQVLDAFMNQIDIEGTTPESFGLPAELDTPGDDDYPSAWWHITSAFAVERITAIVEADSDDFEERLPVEVDPGDADDIAEFLVDEFRLWMQSATRMSLTVPAYIPPLVRYLANGPRKMNEVVTDLVIDASTPKDKPLGVLESLLDRIAKVEAALSER